MSPKLIFLDPFVFSKSLPERSRFTAGSTYAPILFRFEESDGTRYLRLHIHRSVVKEFTERLVRPPNVSLVAPAAS